MTAWWLKARARLNRTSNGSSAINFFVTYRRGSVEYLGLHQKSSESSLVPNPAAVAVHLPRPTRGLPWSYGGRHEDWSSWESQKCYMEKDWVIIFP